MGIAYHKRGKMTGVQILTGVAIGHIFPVNRLARCGGVLVAVMAVTGIMFYGKASADVAGETLNSQSAFPLVQLATPGGNDSYMGHEYLVNAQLAQVADDADVNDPLEGFNRAMFAFNDVVYSDVLGPVADAYNVLPSEARTVVSNFFSNLGEPLVFVNNLLQGEPRQALNTFTRFVLNSTLGLAGLADVATAENIQGRDEDFGQTLAVWGVDEGFYLVLPVLGPSNPRDALGLYVDTVLDPLNIYLNNHDEDERIIVHASAVSFTKFAGVRGDLALLKKHSVDYYVATRSLYRQRRAAEIANGEGDADLPMIPDFDFSDTMNEDADEVSQVTLPQ